MKENNQEPIVYVLQEVPGTRAGRPKFNIIGAQKYGKLKVLLREDSQVVMSPGPIKFKLLAFPLFTFAIIAPTIKIICGSPDNNK